jgi:methyl-accepting chemotaxis protein
VSRREIGYDLQAFVIHLMLSALAFALVLALGIGALLLVRWALPLELASSSPQRALEASGRILELHERFWPVTFVSLVGVALAAAWLGRRITGPLVRFRMAFARLAEGEVPEPVQIRSTDYLAHEVAAFNRMLAALKERGARQAEARAEVLAALEELSERAAASGEDTLATLAARALERLKASHGRTG